MFRKIAGIVLLIILLLGGTAGYFGWSILYQNNINLSKGKSVILLIPTGSDFNRVTDSLSKKNLIRLWSFEWLSKLKKYPGKIHPGRYRIRAGMSNNELVNLLKAGWQEPVRFTFNNI